MLYAWLFLGQCSQFLEPRHQHEVAGQPTETPGRDCLSISGIPSPASDHTSPTATTPSALINPNQILPQSSRVSQGLFPSHPLHAPPLVTSWTTFPLLCQWHPALHFHQIYYCCHLLQSHKLPHRNKIPHQIRPNFPLCSSIHKNPQPPLLLIKPFPLNTSSIKITQSVFLHL